MTIRRGGWVRLGIGLGLGLALALLGIATTGAFGPPWANSARAQNFGGVWSNLTGGGTMPLPPLPPEGAWGEIIMANEKWLVVQNHQGQQFPIALDAIQQFLIRWPTSLDALTNASLVEAIGAELGSNTLTTTHVDVFEGSDQTLVSPGYSSVLSGNRAVTAIDPGFNRYMNGFDVSAQNMLYAWAYPVTPGLSGLPSQLHVVGSVVNLSPLRVMVPGRNFANILPPPGGEMTLAQVTRGSWSFAQKGDYVFLMPVQVTPRTLLLAQLVLYKKVPRAQFAR